MANQGETYLNVNNSQCSLEFFYEEMHKKVEEISKYFHDIKERLMTWKLEQHRMANKIVGMNYTMQLEEIQPFCRDLVENLLLFYEQVNGVVNAINQNEVGYLTDWTEYLVEFERWKSEIFEMLQITLNSCLIVESQPQIIGRNIKFKKDVVVSLLIDSLCGKSLIKEGTRMTTEIMIEDDNHNLHVAIGNGMEILNGSVPMKNNEKVTFKKLVLKWQPGTKVKKSGLVTENKICLRFKCKVTVGSLELTLSTNSLCMVIVSHSSQETMAAAVIAWDNAFCQIGRRGFEVPNVAAWQDVAQIMNAMFFNSTGKGLTDENLSWLKQRLFRFQDTSMLPQPNMISWQMLCKESLPGTDFTLWKWFYSAFQLIEKEETGLKKLWKQGLITGFIKREDAEALLASSKPGTFLIRFLDTISEALSICVSTSNESNKVSNLGPYRMFDLKAKHLSINIKETKHLKFLFQSNCQPICKDQAFGPFYTTANSQNNNQNGNGYVRTKTVQIIPDSSEETAAPTDSAFNVSNDLSKLLPINGPPFANMESMQESSTFSFQEEPMPGSHNQNPLLGVPASLNSEGDGVSDTSNYQIPSLSPESMDFDCSDLLDLPITTSFS